MIFDKQLQLSADQVVAATGYSTDYIDFGADRDVGAGRPMWLVVFSKAAPDGTSPTITISIETDSASGFGTAKTL